MSDLFAPIEALAKEWAEQPTDYDEDTEQQIEDGHTLLAALAEARSQVKAREEWGVRGPDGNAWREEPEEQARREAAHWSYNGNAAPVRRTVYVTEWQQA